MPAHTVPQRSGVPRVVGILAIIFSSIGVGLSAVITWGALHDIRWFNNFPDGSADNQLTTWLYLWMAISVALFVLHLAGGILAFMFRPSGPRLLTAYAVGAIALVLIDVIVVQSLVSDGLLRDVVGKPRLGYAIAALPWPIVVLSLINGRRAKQACAAPHGP